MAGLYAGGTPLLATREQAKKLGVGRNTVINAYEKLKSEDLVVSSVGANYIVNPKIKQILATNAVKSHEIEEAFYINFNDFNHKIDSETVKRWYKFTVAEMSLFDFFDVKENYGFRGVNELQESIKQFVYSYSKIRCDCDQIIIGNIMEYQIGNICQLLGNRLRKVAIGNLNNKRLIEIFKKNGIELFDYYNITAQTIEYFEENNINCVFTTPSHFHDLGEVITLKEKKLLLDWAAKKNDRFIIEDNYSCEYVYQNESPSIFSLDNHGVVFYINNFSQLLGSDIRTNYLIIPKQYVEALDRECWYRSASNPFMTQWLIHRFIETQNADQFILHNKKRYQSKMNTMIYQIKRLFGRYATVSGISSGLSLCMSLKTTLTNRELQELALKKGVTVGYVDELFLKNNQCHNGLILNFAYLSEKKINEGIKLLYEAYAPYLNL